MVHWDLGLQYYNAQVLFCLWKVTALDRKGAVIILYAGANCVAVSDRISATSQRGGGGIRNLVINYHWDLGLQYYNAQLLFYLGKVTALDRKGCVIILYAGGDCVSSVR